MPNMTKLTDWEYGDIHIVTQDRPATGGKAHTMNSAAKPRTRSMAATSDCKVIRADGSSYTIPKYTRREPSAATVEMREKARIERLRVARQERQNRAVDIQNALDSRHRYSKDMAPIGDID